VSTEVKIIADSIAEDGARITTFILKYPRFIHAELLTHRQFSRNASSSRAIPAKKIRERISNDMATPIHWGANKKGMQADSEVSAFKQKIAKIIWRVAGKTALFLSYLMDKLGVHKQVTNRITEPFQHITVVLTSTSFSNFFALRYHHMAQPELQELAKGMFLAYSLNNPHRINKGGWHLPFVTQHEQYMWGHQDQETLIKMSVARCARVSYNNVDGVRPSVQEDLILYDRLVGSHPKHLSSAEHQATPCGKDFYSGNFKGWDQYRKMLENENIEEFTEPLK
jgi:thymidylate synthase ThyX